MDSEKPREIFFPIPWMQYFRAWETSAPNRPTGWEHFSAEFRAGFEDKARVNPHRNFFPSWVWKLCILPTPKWLKARELKNFAAMEQTRIKQEFLAPGPLDGLFWKFMSHGIILSTALGSTSILFNSFVYITFHIRGKGLVIVFLIQRRLGALFISPHVRKPSITTAFYKFWRWIYCRAFKDYTNRIWPNFEGWKGSNVVRVLKDKQEWTPQSWKWGLSNRKTQQWSCYIRPIAEL